MNSFPGFFVLITIFATFANIDSTQGQQYYSGYSAIQHYYQTNNGPIVINHAAVVVGPPPPIVFESGTPSRTVLNNATRGSVVEYTHNGNGYIATPGSSYQSVISTGPSVFPSTTVIQSIQPPVVIQSRATSEPLRQPGPTQLPNKDQSDVVLSLPKEAAGPLTYRLNGTLYSIKPGFSHSFPADRRWTIEFLRNGQIDQTTAYDLIGGSFAFVSDQSGWDLRRISSIPSRATPSPAPTKLLPPPVPAPAPVPSPDI